MIETQDTHTPLPQKTNQELYDEADYVTQMAYQIGAMWGTNPSRYINLPNVVRIIQSACDAQSERLQADIARKDIAFIRIRNICFASPADKPLEPLAAARIVDIAEAELSGVPVTPQPEQKLQPLNDWIPTGGEGNNG